MRCRKSRAARFWLTVLFVPHRMGAQSAKLLCHAELLVRFALGQVEFDGKWSTK